MKLFIINSNVTVSSSIPFEQFKYLIELYRRGFITDALLPVEHEEKMIDISISCVDSASTFAHVYMQANQDRRQIEALGKTINPIIDEVLRRR